MVTTMPRIHVVLMGIEKLVPRWRTWTTASRCSRDRRRAKITVYTTLARSPRGPSDADGEELHVRVARQRPQPHPRRGTAEILGCIRCGACLNACPIYRTIVLCLLSDTSGSRRRDPDAGAPRPRRVARVAACEHAVLVPSREVSGSSRHPRMLLALRHEGAGHRARGSGHAMKMFAFMAASRPAAVSRRRGSRAGRWAAWRGTVG
jgi:ferredoxin